MLEWKAGDRFHVDISVLVRDCGLPINDRHGRVLHIDDGFAFVRTDQGRERHTPIKYMRPWPYKMVPKPEKKRR